MTVRESEVKVEWVPLVNDDEHLEGAGVFPVIVIYAALVFGTALCN